VDAERFRQAETLANTFRTFNCARRILILWALEDAEMSVGQIADAIGASAQNTSQHLQMMKERGILASRREGQTIFYQITDPNLLKRYGLAYDIG
jgi:DNA-binding transcriptional ArsR family regulator